MTGAGAAAAGGEDPTVRPGEPLGGRCVLVLVGLTGAGKTTTVERLARQVPLAAILPDRRALTDRLILPLMTGGDGAVTDRRERFRLTAAFKDRHPGGMGEVLSWLLLPPGLPPGPILFDGLRGAAEVTAAAALPRAWFVVLDCPPEARLWRLCGRNDPFDQAAVAGPSAGSSDRIRALDAALRSEGFEALVGPSVFDRLLGVLAERDVAPDVVARSAAIIVEESRHYDPKRAGEALRRLVPERTLSIDTAALDAAAVTDAIAAWMQAA